MGFLEDPGLYKCDEMQFESNDPEDLPTLFRQYSFVTSDDEIWWIDHEEQLNLTDIRGNWLEGDSFITTEGLSQLYIIDFRIFHQQLQSLASKGDVRLENLLRKAAIDALQSFNVHEVDISPRDVKTHVKATHNGYFRCTF